MRRAYAMSYRTFYSLSLLIRLNYRVVSVTYLTGKPQIQASRGLLLRLHYTLLYYALERCTLYLFRL